eukprot:166900-Alexandrium_andersonii.AAC.1
MEGEAAAGASAATRLRGERGTALPAGGASQGAGQERELQTDAGASATATRTLLPGEAWAGVVGLGGQGNCGWLALAFRAARAVGAPD